MLCRVCNQALVASIFAEVNQVGIGSYVARRVPCPDSFGKKFKRTLAVAACLTSECTLEEAAWRLVA
jgi:hypothetical protein